MPTPAALIDASIRDRDALWSVIDAANTSYTPFGQESAAERLSRFALPSDVLDGWPVIMTRPRSRKFTAADVHAIWTRAAELGLLIVPDDVTLHVLEPGSPPEFGRLGVTIGGVEAPLDFLTSALLLPTHVRTRTGKTMRAIEYTVDHVNAFIDTYRRALAGEADREDEVPFVAGWDSTQPMTDRVRLFLSCSLTQVGVELDTALDLAEAGCPLEGDDFIQRFPVSTRCQPVEWWRGVRDETFAYADRLRANEGTAPHNPAQEAALALATTPDMVANTSWWLSSGDSVDWFRLHLLPAAIDSVTHEDLQDGGAALGSVERYLESLAEEELDPSAPDQFDWGRLVGDLIGDEDILMVMSPSLDGVEDPSDADNRYLGMGDYRPSAWLQPFAGYAPETAEVEPRALDE